MRVGLFGGSFNPPHMGHALACFYLLETTKLDCIWLVPTFKHAFSKTLAPYEDRLEMCRLLARSFNERMKVSEIESAHNGISYTIDTVRSLQALHPELEFDWIIGADILAETERWKDFDTLQTLIRFRVIGRQGFPGLGGIEIPRVSSSEVRRRLHDGESVRELVSADVLAFIGRRGLYRAP